MKTKSYLTLTGILIACGCGGFTTRSAAADLSPTRSLVLERATGDVAFSADLKWLAAGQADGNVAVWNLANGGQTASWPGNGSIAFVSRTNELLVVEGTNLTVRELLTGQVLRRLESPTNTVNSLTISASGNVAATTVGARRQLVFWNLDDGKIIQGLPTHHYPWEWEFAMRSTKIPDILPISMSAGLCRAVSPDGSRFAVGQSSAQVDVWTLAVNNYIHYLGTVSEPGMGMSTSERAEALAFLDNQRLAVVYNREQLAVLTLGTNDVRIMQTLPRMAFTAKTPDGNIVTGEVVASQKYQATTQIQRLGLTPVTVELASDGMNNYVYRVTNTIGSPVVGPPVKATNSAAAAAQFKKFGLEHGQVVAVPDDFITVQSRERASQDKLNQHPDWSLLQKSQTLIGKPGLEIRSLAVSGDGRRLAVAGMRMAWRQGVFAPPGDGLYDVPVNAELQIWDAVEMKLLATIKGRPDEKFAQVALDETGGRVAAVTFGVTYYAKMSFGEQQESERAPASARRVYFWELPSDKTESK